MTKLDDSFFNLTPERVLESVEVGGRRATGYALALNSLENRVYEVELEDETRLVAKFYRPGRWSRAAILAEHAFLRELEEAEVPVAAPLDLGDGTTLRESPAEGGALHYAVWPKVRGRVPEELTDPQLAQLGRLVARLHTVGAARGEPDRPSLTPDSYGGASLRVLMAGSWIPDELKPRFSAATQAIVDACTTLWRDLPLIRIHGDCHLGNLLWGASGPFFVDFDDFLTGPPVQDLWLMAPGRDEDALRQRELLADAYEEMRDFDRRTLKLVEPLRALRILRYAAWIAQRWQDPAFQRTFPQFTEFAHWQREVQELEDQLRRF
ncbi:MAG TPA: serine/threonine protein kinase [Kofleriaceae bacterium]|nr:serine/threonine protein kinase [Kofleriaceae bacterium]